jgi:hypothetical protein
MSKFWKALVILIVLFIGVNIAKKVINITKTALTSPDGKYDVIDGMVGNLAVDKFLEIKEKRDTFNLPAFKTGLMMFQTQHGRFPKDMAELENAGDVGAGITRDRFGNQFHMQVMLDRSIILMSAGKDKIKGTTDDLKYKVPM